MRVWFVTSLLLALALSGCAGEETPETTETEIPEGGTFEETGTAENATENNTIPTATLTVHVPAGFAPVNVLFNFSIDGFADASFVDWTLDVDGDGFPEAEGFGGLPGNYTQTFSTQGNFTAIFEAFDDTHTVSVEATFAIIEEELPPPQEPIQLTGTAGPGILGTPATTETFEVTQIAQKMTITMTFSGVPLVEDLDWTIFNPSGTEVGGGAAGGQEAPEEFTLATPGTWSIDVEPFTSAAASYTIDIIFE